MNPRFIFQVVPYVAIVSLTAGLMIRYIRGQRRTDTSTSTLRKGPEPGHWKGLLCLSVLLLLLGHLAGIAFPQQVLAWNSVAFRLYSLETLGFSAGIVALAGSIGLVWSQTRQPGRTVKEHLSDEVFLTLLLMTLLTGSVISVIYRWGSSWGVITLTPYLRSLFRLKPIVELPAEMPFLVRLHVFSGFVTLLLFPFTRFGKLLLLVFDFGASALARPIAVPVERAQQALWVMLERLNPAKWLWPEED